jgi:two-component system, OmpR family, response regulator RegX3
MTTVLVVEDEIEIARVVRDYLRNAGFEVIVVGDGGSAVASVRSSKPDLLVLDLGLPGRDGLDVAREIRRWSTTPIVMLTARGDETDRIVGLELGADDYVVKPFSARELVARVRAVLRRAAEAGERRAEGATEIGELRVDPARRTASFRHEELELSRKEFDLLRLLVDNAGSVVTRERLIDEVWDTNWFGSTKTLDVHVSGLRKKLEDDPNAPRYIHTVRGVGFRFASGDEV